MKGIFLIKGSCNIIFILNILETLYCSLQNETGRNNLRFSLFYVHLIKWQQTPDALMICFISRIFHHNMKLSGSCIYLMKYRLIYKQNFREYAKLILFAFAFAVVRNNRMKNIEINIVSCLDSYIIHPHRKPIDWHSGKQQKHDTRTEAFKLNSGGKCIKGKFIKYTAG